MITIDDIAMHPLKQISDERGRVMHMLRRDDPWFLKFGEIYFSMVYKSKIKGWHRHSKMNLNYVCVSGAVKLVVYDGVKFWETILSPKKEQYNLVTIPRGLWNAFKGLENESIIANCSTHPFFPGEKDTIDPYLPLVEGIPYTW